MINSLLNILFPEKCPVCGNRSDSHRVAPICTECWHLIHPYEGPKCGKCGNPLISDTSITCHECITDEPAFESAASFGLYNGALKKAINLLKYYGLKRLSKPLSELLLQNGIPQADAVIPVPLHEKRLRHREFNQSALIAHTVAKESGIPLELDALVKTKDTEPQVGLSYKGRIKNISRAFEVKNKKLIEGKNILLIDDVITTGATVRECSKTLKKAGAAQIRVLTLAHGIQD